LKVAELLGFDGLAALAEFAAAWLSRVEAAARPPEELEPTRKTIKLAPLIDAAIRRKGLAVPVTPEDVAAMEAELENDKSDIPSRLLVAPDFFAPEVVFRLRAGVGLPLGLSNEPDVDSKAAES